MSLPLPQAIFVHHLLYETPARNFPPKKTACHMNSMKIIIPLHHISLKKDSKQCCDTTTPKSIHTKDESKRGFAFAFIFGVN